MANSKEWKKTKTIYWSNELRDDFNEVGLKRPEVPENYRYIRKNPITHFLSAILYHLIAKPIFFITCTVHGIKFKDKWQLKELNGKGAYIYSNHVSISDAWKFQAKGFLFKHKVYTLGYPDTLSMPIVASLARGLGYLPVPSMKDVKNLVKLTEACLYYVDKGNYVLIYPEAHIWPYYTHIRNFSSGSFTYPAKGMQPIIPAVTIFRKPLIGKKPRQTVYFCKPIYPKAELSFNENKMYLYKECLREMKEMSDAHEQMEYIKYIYVEKEPKND